MFDPPDLVRKKRVMPESQFSVKAGAQDNLGRVRIRGRSRSNKRGMVEGSRMGSDVVGKSLVR